MFTFNPVLIMEKEGIEFGSLASNPLKAIECVGDPVVPAFAGLVLGAASRVPVLMAGGTQMGAVLAVLKSMGGAFDNVAVATTRWIVSDRASDLKGIVTQIADVPILAANLDFNSSRFEGLRKYEAGVVKEGVGAGGAAVAAMLKSKGRITKVFCLRRLKQATSISLKHSLERLSLSLIGDGQTIMIKQVKNLVAFLTILPVGMDANCLEDAANYIYLFPIVGAFIGLLTGLFALILQYALPSPITGTLTLGFILLITGLHHTDGLLDFGDGLMYQGSPEEKIEVMHDQQTGAGGLVLGLVTLLTTGAAIATVSSAIILQSLLISEVLAKFSMTFEAWLGRSAHTGMNSQFIDAMHSRGRHLRLGVALIISLSFSIASLGLSGLFSVIGVILSTSTIVGISSRHFKGVTGDVFGATNDLSRMVSLLIILAMSRWV